MRCVFMGTPAFAVPSLEALHRHGHRIAEVITQPDRPAGRGKKLTPSPVKTRSLELGLSVYQPERIKAAGALERLREIAPDVIVVVGYGQIIPKTIIDLPPHGCVNVHASLLPCYRGAAPVAWAIAQGETVTGVTTMRIVEKLDAGGILLQRETPIGGDETAPELSERLSRIGADLLIETLGGIEERTIAPRKQDDALATYAPILKREHGRIDWNLPAQQIANRVRGFEPWPGAYTSFRGKRLHIRRARALPGLDLRPGSVSVDRDTFLVGCGNRTALRVEEVQLEGKKRMPAADFVHGHRPREGGILGESAP